MDLTLAWGNAINFFFNQHTQSLSAFDCLQQRQAADIAKSQRIDQHPGNEAPVQPVGEEEQGKQRVTCKGSFHPDPGIQFQRVAALLPTLTSPLECEFWCAQESPRFF